MVILGALSSNQINIATFVHQMGIYTKYAIYWFASKYASSMLLARVIIICFTDFALYLDHLANIQFIFLTSSEIEMGQL